MKKWIKFFFLSFFSNKQAKEGTKRGLTSAVLGLILALVFTCVGLIGAEALPFGTHYNNSGDFKALARNAFANPDGANGISLNVVDGKLQAKVQGDYKKGLIVNTFDSQEDATNYAKGEYQLVVDTRSADALAKVEALCVSTDEQKTTITYEEYLTLNDVAKRNFEFKLKYTGEELVLSDADVENYKAYVEGTSQDNKNLVAEILEKLEKNEITKEQYNRAMYALYFSEYYPEITQYESSSRVPLLRNYYFHEHIDNGANKFLMVFDDCMIGSFKTGSGIDVLFYGVYSNIADGELISAQNNQTSRFIAVDGFIRNSFMATMNLSTYIYIMNTIRLVPIIAIMVVVVAMLMYSVLSLKGAGTFRSFSASLKVTGSFIWVSGLISAILTVILSFIVPKNLISVFAIVGFFVTILIRTIVLIIAEIKKRKAELKALSESEGENQVKTEA